MLEFAKHCAESAVDGAGQKNCFEPNLGYCRYSGLQEDMEAGEVYPNRQVLYGTTCWRLERASRQRFTNIRSF